MAIDPAIINGALQEIRRQATQHKAVLALSEHLSDLTELYAEVEFAKRELEGLKFQQEKIRSERDAADKASSEQAEQRNAAADRYVESRKAEAETIIANAKTQANQVAIAQQVQLEKAMKEHQAKIGPISQEHARLEESRNDHQRTVTALKLEYAKLDQTLQAKRTEHQTLQSKHAEFLRSIGLR